VSRGQKGNRQLAVALLPLGVVAALASLLSRSTADPTRLVLDQAWCAVSRSHLLGCGEGGIDVASFVGHACLRVLVMALVVSALGAVVGVTVGSLAAVLRGRLERIVIQVCDLVQAFPTFLLALSVLAATPEPTRWHLGAVFLLTAWAPFARLSQASARALGEAEFVVAARALGASRLRVIFWHIIPHLFGPIAVQLGTAAAGIVLGESALGFVGLGPADGVSLGALLDQGTVGMLRTPRVLLVAAVAVGATSGTLQWASEGIRRRLTGMLARPSRSD
jgi:peptide/nickel transport system permease protein